MSIGNRTKALGRSFMFFNLGSRFGDLLGQFKFLRCARRDGLLLL